MADERLSRDLERFIAEHVASVAQLEILLHLRAAGGRALDADEIGRSLRIDARWAARELRTLATEGLVAEDAGSPAPLYRFAPRSPELAAGFEALAAAYQGRRVAVITAIAEAPSQHLRLFADAFRLRKD